MSGKQPETGAALYVGRRAFVHLGLAALVALPLAGIARAHHTEDHEEPDAPPVPPNGELHILAFGDSLTAGFGLPRRQGFAPQLQAYLRRQGVRAFVTNGGVSGDTAAQGLQRLAWTLDGMARKPDLAIVALGANDMLRGLEAILVELKRRGIRILLSGMVASPNLGQDFAVSFNRIYPELAARHRTVLHPFFLDGVAADRTLNQPDGLHPNFEGVKRIVMGIAPKVIETANRT
jgi:acyl-CoA thioesterase-1